MGLCQRDPDRFGFGSTLGRLLLRTLPNNYTDNSMYTWFPLMTPGAMKPHLTKLNVINKYSLERPKTVVPARNVTEYAEIGEIFSQA